MRAVRGEFDGIVAMYHDQGHIPLKLLGGLQAVNVSVGLPIVRTSVAHGTAYDIAGHGKADPAWMLGQSGADRRGAFGGRLELSGDISRKRPLLHEAPGARNLFTLSKSIFGRLHVRRRFQRELAVNAHLSLRESAGPESVKETKPWASSV